MSAREPETTQTQAGGSEEEDDQRTGDHHLVLPLPAVFALFAVRGRVAAGRAEGRVEALDVAEEVVFARERLRARRVRADVALLALVDRRDVDIPVVRPVEHYRTRPRPRTLEA